MTDKETLAKVLSTPDGYAEVFLKMKLHPTQRNVLKSLFDITKNKTRVSFVCANECGKTSTVSAAAILYSIHILNCKVVFTSASYRQIISQLLPSIKNFSHLYPKWRFLENKIIINNEIRLIAFSTESEGTFQGHHSTEQNPLLIITDESAAIKEQIFMAIDRCNAKFLLIEGSPLGPEGVFYSMETEPNMHKAFIHYKLNKLQCLKKDGYWLNEEDIQELIEKWGREHPLVLSSVFAEFANNVEGGVISLNDIENCIRTPALPDYSGGKHVALDFAAGGDSNVIVFRNGNELKIIKEWKDRDTMNASRTFANELDTLKREYGITQSDVSGDNDGLGKPMIDRLSELGWNINRFHGGATAKDTSCKNLITDYWINACKKIRNRSIVMPNNQELKLQLTSRKSYMNQSGKLALESKEDMRSRGVPSPDIADAFCMALGTPVNGLVTFLKVPLPTPRKYSIF